MGLTPLFAIVVIFTSLVLFLILIFMDKELKRTNEKLENYTSNLKNYTGNKNDFNEEISCKLKNLESYTAELERKIITLKTDIEALKMK